MRRIVSSALTVLMAFSVMLSLATTANANALAGGGNSSSYSGESVFTNQPAGGSGQFSAIFFNDGSTTWAPGVVGLLVCAADKTTCNVTSPNAAYASGWYSSTVYATVSATVPPGSNGFFIYNFVVPAGTAAGTAATFNGDVGMISNGLEFRPQGYFQVNTTPSATGGLTLSPTSAALSVGGTQQFTATGAPSGTTVNWSVTGGCGAITSAGLFAATATNSATQPCNVVATAGGLTASAPITVFGPATSIACSANPATVTGNGADTTVVTASLKDANGNTVSNNSSTNLIFSNDTPTKITPTGQATMQTSNGTASVTYTTVSGASGTAQVSVSSGTLTGCNVLITISAVGTATKATAAFSPTTIASDGTSMSRLRVTIQDANGNTIASDGATVVTVSRSSGANICNIGGSGSASGTVTAGIVNFTVTSTSTPGTCQWDATTSPTLTGSSATLTTIIVGVPNKLAVTTAPSSATVGDTANAPVAVITVQDANGNRITSPTYYGIPIATAYDTNTCTGVTNAAASTGSSPSTAGRATFTFTSTTANSGCVVTFSGTLALAGVTSTTTTVVFTPGPATGLTCSFSPTQIFADGASTSSGRVRVVDQYGNNTGVGTYSVSFNKVSGTSSTQLTASPQNTTNGAFNFTVRSTTTAGSDVYNASGVIVGTTTSTSPNCTLNVGP